MLTPSIIRRKKRVLIGTPHSDKKNYCIEEYIARVKTFTYPYYDVLIVDNSETRKNYKRFIKEGFKAIHIKPKNHSIQKILAESHDAIRKYAIANNYDYLFHLESDLVPPPVMAQRMETFGDLRETISLKEGSDLINIDGKLMKVFHCGLGCVLMHKNILNEFEFRHEKGLVMHPDGFFAIDTDALGIQKYIDTSILCEHNNSDWTQLLLRKEINMGGISA